MKNRNYPIILGHPYRKGLLAFREPSEGGSLRLLICRLKKEYEAGETFEYGDVENVEAELWFCDRDTVQTTVNVLEKILKEWKE